MYGCYYGFHIFRFTTWIFGINQIEMFNFNLAEVKISTCDNFLQMQWTCKHCHFSLDKRGQLFKHYRLKHGGFTQQQPIVCLHHDCLCTFKSFNALKVHLSVWHSKSDNGQANKPTAAFHCQLCYYIEPCTEAEIFTH